MLSMITIQFNTTKRYHWSLRWTPLQWYTSQETSILDIIYIYMKRAKMIFDFNHIDGNIDKKSIN